MILYFNKFRNNSLRWIVLQWTVFALNCAEILVLNSHYAELSLRWILLRWLVLPWTVFALNCLALNCICVELSCAEHSLRWNSCAEQLLRYIFYMEFSSRAIKSFWCCIYVTKIKFSFPCRCYCHFFGPDRFESQTAVANYMQSLRISIPDSMCSKKNDSYSNSLKKCTVIFEKELKGFSLEKEAVCVAST